MEKERSSGGIRMKIYRSGMEVLLAASDEEIVGRILRSDGLKLEAKEEFYGARSATREEFLEGLRSCTVANLLGSRVVSLAVEEGYVDPSTILSIEGVPHAQIARL